MKATIIGAGNIGMALAEGLIRSGLCKKSDITITRRTISSLETYAAAGFKTSNNNPDAIRNADTIFICVLPQQLDTVLEELKSAVNVKKQLFVSVVTGAGMQAFRNKLGDKIRIIRTMPNTAMKVGESMTCLAEANATQKDIALVQNIFNTMGQCIVINEEMMSAAT